MKKKVQRKYPRPDRPRWVQVKMELYYNELGELFVQQFQSSKSPSDDVILTIEDWARGQGMRIRMDRSLAPRVEMAIRNGGADLVKAGVRELLDRLGKNRLP